MYKSTFRQNLENEYNDLYFEMNSEDHSSKKKKKNGDKKDGKDGAKKLGKELDKQASNVIEKIKPREASLASKVAPRVVIYGGIADGVFNGFGVGKSIVTAPFKYLF